LLEREQLGGNPIKFDNNVEGVCGWY